MAFDHIGGAEPSTLTFKLATVSMTRNSSKMHQEIMSIGDQLSSLGIAAVLNSTPGSSAWGLVVRHADDVGVQVLNSPTVQVEPGVSPIVVSGVVAVTGNVDVVQASTVWEVQAAIRGNSTVHQGTSPWVIGGNSTVAPLAGSTWATRPIQSSQSDLRMTAYQSTYADQKALVQLSQGLDSSGATVNFINSANNALNVVTRSTKASDMIVTAYQSSAAEFQATVQQNSTVWAVQLTQWSTTFNVSSLGGIVAIAGNCTVAPLSGSTWATRPIQSSQSDLRMTAYQSTAGDFIATVNIRDGSSQALVSTTVKPSSGTRGLVVRQVTDALTTFASTSALASTSVSVASSVAATRIYVTAYSITSTNQTPAHWGFFSSNATLLWPMTLAAISSGVAGANLAVSAPGYLFRTAAADALNFKTAGSTVAGVQMAVSYYTAP
jgi:hypothetical protein